jgi:hypothetical protein
MLAVAVSYLAIIDFFFPTLPKSSKKTIKHPSILNPKNKKNKSSKESIPRQGIEPHPI